VFLVGNNGFSGIFELFFEENSNSIPQLLPTFPNQFRLRKYNLLAKLIIFHFYSNVETSENHQKKPDFFPSTQETIQAKIMNIK
jgi:hypothetical protein